MSWMRRGDEDTDQNEKEWISQLLEPLQSDDQSIDEVSEQERSSVLIHPEPSTRSVAEVIDQLDSQSTTRLERPTVHHTPPADSESTVEIPAVTSVPGNATAQPDSPELELVLTEALLIAGATAIAVIDAYTGTMIDYRLAEQTNNSASQHPWREWRNLALDDAVEELFITVDTQYHVIRAINSGRSTHRFFYLVLDRDVANLAMARHRLGQINSQFTARQSTSAE
ncbi:MAG: hypothetical protein ABI137_03985 [Antricoccus sp.]